MSNKAKTPQIFVISGPNLNLLGQREPEIYGPHSLAEIEVMCMKEAKKFGCEAVCFQSNHEGELIDRVQQARRQAAGIVINGAGYSHTSVALRDALRMVGVPAVEVHLSNVFTREDFRHHSMLAPVIKGMICGFGAQSYVLAVNAVATFITPPSKRSK